MFSTILDAGLVPPEGDKPLFTPIMALTERYIETNIHVCIRATMVDCQNTLKIFNTGLDNGLSPKDIGITMMKCQNTSKVVSRWLDVQYRFREWLGPGRRQANIHTNFGL